MSAAALAAAPLLLRCTNRAAASPASAAAMWGPLVTEATRVEAAAEVESSSKPAR